MGDFVDSIRDVYRSMFPYTGITPRKSPPERGEDIVKNINTQSFAEGMKGIGDVYNSQMKRTEIGRIATSRIDVEA